MRDPEEILNHYLKLEFFVKELERIYTTGTGKKIEITWNDETNEVEGEVFRFIKDILNVKIPELNDFSVKDVGRYYKAKLARESISNIEKFINILTSSPSK